MGVVSHTYVKHAHFAQKLPILPPFRQKHAHFAPFRQKVPISYFSSTQKMGRHKTRDQRSKPEQNSSGS